MFSITKDKNSLSYGYTEYTVDTIADIQKLPTDRAPGSVAFVVENASVYVLNNNQEWKPLDDSSSSGGGGSSGPQVQSDWNVNDETDPAFIKNKPEITPGTKFFTTTIPANGWIKENDIFTQEIEVPYLVSDGLAFYDTTDTNIENIEEYGKITEILIDTNLIKVSATTQPALDLNIEISIIGSVQDKPIYLFKPKLDFDKKEIVIPEDGTSDNFNIITNSDGVITLENSDPNIYEAKLDGKKVSITKKDGYGRKKLKVLIEPSLTYRQKEKEIPIIIKKTQLANLLPMNCTSLIFVDDSFVLPVDPSTIDSNNKKDISEKQDGSVIAYTIPSTDGTSIEVYVVIKGTHISPVGEDVSFLFASMNFNGDSLWNQLIKLKNFFALDTSKVTSMHGMFYRSLIPTLDLSSFDTSKVTDMSGMFNDSQATTIDLSSFDTSKVTDMSGMFNHSQATTIDLSSFETSNVTDMNYMFSDSKMTIIDLSSFNTSKVINMNAMFYCSKATTIVLSSFNTANVTDMNSMFSGSQVTALDLSSFDTVKVTDMGRMFNGSQVTTLDLSNFDTSNVTDMNYMFNNSKVTTLDLSNFDTSKVTNMESMFSESQATTLDLSSFNTSNVTNMYNMFSESQATNIYCRTEEDKQRFLASGNCTPTADMFIVGKPIEKQKGMSVNE